MKTQLVNTELHVWKCICYSVYNEFLIAAVICDTVLPYHILQRDDIVNFIIAVPCVIVLYRRPSLVPDGECSYVFLDADFLILEVSFLLQIRSTVDCLLSRIKFLRSS